jgi:hypothetical protein
VCSLCADVSGRTGGGDWLASVFVLDDAEVTGAMVSGMGESLSAVAAFVPAGLYLVGLGTVFLRRRPVVISGGVDAAVLAIALAGLVTVGPLFVWGPSLATQAWQQGGLIAVYLAAVAIAILFSRPRLVIYNVTIEQVRPLVAEVLASLEPHPRWAGEAAILPNRGLQMHLERSSGMRAVSLVAMGRRPPLEAWGEVRRRLSPAVCSLSVQPDLLFGGALLCAGVALIAGAFVASLF